MWITLPCLLPFHTKVTFVWSIRVHQMNAPFVPYRAFLYISSRLSTHSHKIACDSNNSHLHHASVDTQPQRIWHLESKAQWRCKEWSRTSEDANNDPTPLERNVMVWGGMQMYSCKTAAINQCPFVWPPSLFCNTTQLYVASKINWTLSCKTHITWGVSRFSIYTEPAFVAQELASLFLQSALGNHVSYISIKVPGLQLWAQPLSP